MNFSHFIFCLRPVFAIPLLSTALLILISLPSTALAAKSEIPKEPKPTETKVKSTLSAAETEESIARLTKALSENEEKIKTTETEIKRIKDADFLPNLYFALADLYVEKSRLLYLIKIESNPNVPSGELDFTAEKRPKQNAVEIYQKIYLFFTNFPRRDRALFYKARELHDLGQAQTMVATYAQLMKEFPESPYWLETNIALGDYMFNERKDVDGALQAYKRVIDKPSNLFTSLAYYRSGWCYVNKGDSENAFRSFDNSIKSYDKVDKTALPEAYTKLDVRRETVAAIVYPLIELYSTPNKKFLLNGQSPTEAIRTRSDTFLTFQKALGRLGRRLIVKTLWQESAEAHLQILETSEDLLLKLEAAQHFYESFKKGKLKNLRFEVFQRQAAMLVQEMRTNTTLSARDRLKNLKEIETFMRDIATTLHGIAQNSKNTRDYIRAYESYLDYEWALPASRNRTEMLVNKAESAFNAGRLVDAGITYEKVIAAGKAGRNRTSSGKDFSESALQAYALALQTPEKLSPTDLVEARTGLREVGLSWLKQNPKNRAAATVHFNIIRSWYDERDFANAIKEVERFITAFPSNDKIMEAIGIALNSFSQLDDYEGLAKAGARYAQSRKLTQIEKDNIRGMVRSAQLKRVQAQAGEFGSREYAKNLKEMAAANKGSELGDQALYEAFISLKSKRDSQTFEIGEQLLRTAADSRYAKEVSATMAQIALTTADFARVAKYFEAYAIKYPKESESGAWLRNAANMYEWMGEYSKARNLFARIGDSESVARMDLLAGDWNKLAVSAQSLSGIKGNYLEGVALVRLNKNSQAAPILGKLATGKGSSADDREMIAHAAYLLSIDALNQFSGIRMRDANDQAALKSKIQIYQSLSKELNRVISLQSGRWTIAALYGLGQANQDLGRFIQNSPMPDGLKGADAAQYQAELKKQAAEYFKQSKQFFTTCLSTAEKFEVFTRFVDGCRAFGSKKIDEAQDTQLSAKATETSPPEAAAIRKKLYDKPRDTDILLSLSQTYINAKDYAMAAAIYNRILEIDPKNSRAQSGRGVAFLYMNDLDRAYSELKKSLEIESKDPIALWNISGLMKEFKFEKKFQEYFRKAKQTKKPALIHPYARRL